MHQEHGPMQKGRWSGEGTRLPVSSPLQGFSRGVVEVLPPGGEHVLHHGGRLLSTLGGSLALVAGSKERIQGQGWHQGDVGLQAMLHGQVMLLAGQVQGMGQCLHHSSVTLDVEPAKLRRELPNNLWSIATEVSATGKCKPSICSFYEL